MSDSRDLHRQLASILGAGATMTCTGHRWTGDKKAEGSDKAVMVANKQARETKVTKF